jgi:hypothetical protein
VREKVSFALQIATSIGGDSAVPPEKEASKDFN